jgi:hypothetical protein
MAMSGAKLAKYGFRRCPGICGEAKTVLRPKLPEQAQAQGINPDRCLSCEQYAVVQNAQKAGTVLGLKEFEDVLDTAGRIHGPALLMYARIFRVISDATITGTVGPVWVPSRGVDHSGLARPIHGGRTYHRWQACRTPSEGNKAMAGKCSS